MKLPACDINSLKSALIIVRWDVEILELASSVSFCRMSINKFDTAVAPVTATLPTAFELFNPCEIDSSARSSPRIPWATAKAEASSMMRRRVVQLRPGSV